MKQKYTEFDNYVITQIKKAFSFLETEYAFLIEEVIVEGSVISVLYKNSTTGVLVFLDDRANGLYVDISRLVNNKIPEIPIYYRKNDRMDSFILSSILSLRAPSLHIDAPNIDDLVFNPGREKVVSSVIKQHAKALKMYAQDVLRGDFSIFNELEKTYKKRLKMAEERLRKEGE